MYNFKIAKIISIVVATAGMMIMLGWIGDIAILKSPHLALADMRFMTAFTFLLSGITIYFIVRFTEGDRDSAQVVLPTVTLIIFLLMMTSLASNFIGVRNGIEDLFIRIESAFSEEMSDTAVFALPDRPSLGTIVGFILIAVAGISILFRPRNIGTIICCFLGLMIVIVGGLALIGYALDVPRLYYILEGISTEMALYSAILFMLCGGSLMLIGREIRKS